MAVLPASKPMVDVACFEERREEVVYERPRALTDTYTHYCPGCTHGIAHRLVAEVIDELGLREETILVASVGCSVFAYNYFDVDACEAPHGRAPAMATGVKRVHPDKLVFTYQGDGDLASIGMGEIVHVAARGEKGEGGIELQHFCHQSARGGRATVAHPRSLDHSRPRRGCGRRGDSWRCPRA